MYGGHQLSVAVEGYLVGTGIFLAYAEVFVISEVIGESGLGRIAEPAVIRLRSIVAERHCEEEFLLGTFTGEAEVADRHTVLGKSAGLVRADYGYTAEALDCLEVLDDSLLLRHLLSADSEGDSDDRAECLRDSGNGKCYREHKRINDRLTVYEVGHQEYEDTDADDSDRKYFAELVKTYLKRSLFLLCVLHKRSDLAYLGVHTDSGNYRNTSSVGDVGAGVDHIHAVAESKLGLVYLVSGFGNVQGLAGEGTLIDLKRGCFEETAVGCGNVSGFHKEDISDNDLRSRYLGLSTVSDDSCAGGAHSFQAVERFLCLDVLCRTEYGVHNEHDEDNDSTSDLAAYHRDY